MGNSASSSRAHNDNSVDYGFLVPQGVYSGNPDWNQQIVAQLIAERRLAPFYRPLEDYDDNWDDEQILAARKQLPDQDVAPDSAAARAEGNGSLHSSTSRTSTIHTSNKRPGALKEPSRMPEATVYRGAVECPICFLYYPPNINHSRCCDQAICTECFVQIKRSEPTTTHVVSEPAACPYCVQDNFGVTYTPPPWRAGIGADGTHTPMNPSRASSQQSVDTNKTRRKSFGADSAEVVTIDQIRPDWEAKLAAVRAAVARRANRRIIMRQVGDRLIPVGVTSGRIHPLATGDAAAGGEQGAENANENEGRGGRRSRRRQHQQQPQDLNQLLGTMGMGGQDIEELMIMEAMRLSLIEHEEQQRKEAEEKKKKEAERIAKGEEPGKGSTTNGENGAGPSSSASAPGLELPSIPMTSPIDVSNSSSRGLLPPDSSSPNRNSSSFGSRSSPASSNTDLASGSGRLGPSPLGGVAPGGGASLGTSINQSRSRSHSRTASASSHAPTPREGADPPPFSMLSAALAAHGAASAVLASSSSSTEPAPANIPDSSSVTQAPISDSDSNSHVHPTAAATLVPVGANQSLSSLFVESAGVAGQSYDALPSSPDSPSHRPLLLETPASENPGPVSGSEGVFGPAGE